MIRFFAVVLSCLLVFGCQPTSDPPLSCEYVPDGSVCDAINGAGCDVGDRAALCPADISPGSDSGCTWAGLCDGMALALYCCSDAEPTLPPFPPNPGDGACRPQADPTMWGCLPAWWLTGEAATPAACGTCGQAGDQVWVCEDAAGLHPPDCARLGDAPYQSSGFYCCGCTI